MCTFLCTELFEREWPHTFALHGEETVNDALCCKKMSEVLFMTSVRQPSPKVSQYPKLVIISHLMLRVGEFLGRGLRD
jgi:hypothetical protein